MSQWPGLQIGKLRGRGTAGVLEEGKEGIAARGNGENRGRGRGF